MGLTLSKVWSNIHLFATVLHYWEVGRGGVTAAIVTVQVWTPLAVVTVTSETRQSSSDVPILLRLRHKLSSVSTVSRKIFTVKKIFIIGSEWRRTGKILTSGCVFVDIVSICSALCQWLCNVTKYFYWCSVTLYWIVHEKETMDPYSTFECERSQPFLAHLPYFLGSQWMDMT